MHKVKYAIYSTNTSFNPMHLIDVLTQLRSSVLPIRSAWKCFILNNQNIFASLMNLFIQGSNKNTVIYLRKSKIDEMIDLKKS